MKFKKSVELTLTTIAVAALVLLVIVVSVILLTGGSQRFAKTINSCETNGGECVGASECKNPTLNFECTKPKVCCSPRIGLV